MHICLYKYLYILHKCICTYMRTCIHIYVNTYILSLAHSLWQYYWGLLQVHEENTSYFYNSVVSKCHVHTHSCRTHSCRIGIWYRYTNRTHPIFITSYFHNSVVSKWHVHTHSCRMLVFVQRCAL